MNGKHFIVVIADDDLDDQEFIKMALAESPHTFDINSVYNGQQLVDYLLKNEIYKNIKLAPDLIFLDLNMPLLDGFAALKLLKSNPVTKIIPVYILSSSQNKNDVEKALSLGANGFYPKTVLFDELKRIIADACIDCKSQTLEHKDLPAPGEGG